jgi:hypothetical protein
MTTATATATATAAATGFQVGQTYYGSLACAHGSFPVTCIKRTEKTIWFEHATLPDSYTPARSRARAWHDGTESANFHGWYVCSTSVKDNGSQAASESSNEQLKEINSEPGPLRWIDDTRRLTLVERVADAIETADDEGLTNMTWNYHARAAIREVAAWIDERELKAQNDPDCLEASTADEAVGWLRNEADR